MKIKLEDWEKKSLESLLKDIKEKKGFLGWLETRYGKTLRRMHELANQLNKELPENSKGNVLNINEETAKACLEYIKLNSKDISELFDTLEKVAGQQYASDKVREEKNIEMVGMKDVLEEALDKNKTSTKKAEKTITKEPIIR